MAEELLFDSEGADWSRRRWTLPPYRSDEFMEILKDTDQTLEEFKQTTMYKAAIAKGLIAKDKWIGPKKAKPKA